MINRGLLVRLDAKPGKEAEVEQFLHAALQQVSEERGTEAWFAVRFGRGKYGIFDVFPDDAERNAHLAGPVAQALRQHADELFETAPRIQKLNILANKLSPGSMGPDTKGLLLTFKAKPGHEPEMEQFLRDAQSLVMSERRTTAWFAIQTEDGEYGIFDVFPSNGGRLTHLTGAVPRELAKHAFTLLGSVPKLKMLNIKAEKLESDAQRIH